MTKQRIITMCLIGLIGIQVTASTEWSGSGGDNNWSNPGNWQSGVPSQTNEWHAEVMWRDKEGIINIDTAPDLASLKFEFNIQTNFTVTGQTLRLQSDPSVNNGRNALWNNDDIYKAIFSTDVLIDGAADVYRIIRAASGAEMIFNGDLIASNAIIQFDGNNTINGRVVADGEVRIGAGTTTFANTLDNSIDGLIVVNNSGGEIIVDTPDGVTFYDGGRLQVNADSAITFNGGHVLGDTSGLTVGSGVTSLTVTFNADENLGVLAIFGSGVVLNLGDDVNSLQFNDSSGPSWNSGPVINNFRPGIIRFGTTDTGLTATQLDSITAYDWDGAAVTNLMIDSDGYLVGDITPDNPYVPPEVGEISASLLSGNEIVISWMSSNAANYAVENTTNLVSGPWVDAVTNLVGTGGSMSVTDTVEQAVSFYRVYSY